MRQWMAMRSGDVASAVSAKASSTGNRSSGSIAAVAGAARPSPASSAANARRMAPERWREEECCGCCGIGSVIVTGLFGHPVEIRGEAAADFDRDRFGQFIRMQGLQPRDQRVLPLGGGLDQQQHFFGPL